jgi:hypothetical protein
MLNTFTLESRVMTNDQEKYVENTETAIEVACWTAFVEESTGPSSDAIWKSRRWRRLLTTTGRAVYQVIRQNGIPFRREMICEWEDYHREIGILVLQKDDHTALIRLAIPEIVFQTYESGSDMDFGGRLVPYYSPEDIEQ